MQRAANGPLARIAVTSDDCWRANVEANIQELELTYDAASNTVLLTGRHRIAAFWSVPLHATLQAADPCPDV